MNTPMSQTDRDMQHIDDVVRIIRQTLQIGDDQPMDANTRLLGAIAEFDSMSVVTVLTTLEEEFGFYVDDDDVSAETFETVGTLLEFVQNKIQLG